jgi:hypothetical protein
MGKSLNQRAAGWVKTGVPPAEGRKRQPARLHTLIRLKDQATWIDVPVNMSKTHP